MNKLSDIEEEIDIAFVADESKVEEVSDQAKIIWFRDAANEKVVNKAQANGTIIVENRCPFSEADRLRRGE